MAELDVGDKAPAFSLKDQDGNRVSLAEFKGKKLLLYFYPKADTPGCTKQACSVRDARVELTKMSVIAIGISPDEPVSCCQIRSTRLPRHTEPGVRNRCTGRPMKA
jgi:peroxiredoxin Q/BCP